MRLVGIMEHQNDPAVTTICVAETDVSTDATGIAIVDTITLNTGNRTTLWVYVLPLEGLQEGTNFALESMDESVASFRDGVLTASSGGETQLICNSFWGEFSDTCIVWVNDLKHRVNLIMERAADSEVIEGATVIVNWYNALSDSEGKAAFDGLQPGKLQYSVSMDNYETAYSTFYFVE